MPDFRVSWDIEVAASSHEEAAKIALAVQRDQNSIATVFSVSAPGLGSKEVDLSKVRRTQALLAYVPTEEGDFAAFVSITTDTYLMLHRWVQRVESATCDNHFRAMTFAFPAAQLWDIEDMEGEEGEFFKNFREQHAFELFSGPVPYMKELDTTSQILEIFVHDGAVFLTWGFGLKNLDVMLNTVEVPWSSLERRGA